MCDICSRTLDPSRQEGRMCSSFFQHRYISSVRRCRKTHCTCTTSTPLVLLLLNPTAWKRTLVAELNQANPRLSLFDASSNTCFLSIRAAARPTRGNTKEKRERLREPARAPKGERAHQQQIDAFPNTLPAAAIRSAFFARGEVLEGGSTVAAATAARTARAS